MRWAGRVKVIEKKRFIETIYQWFIEVPITNLKGRAFCENRDHSFST